MINEFFFLGKPALFKNKFYVYPPSIDEVLDTKDFGIYKNLLMITQEEIEDQIVGDPDNYLKFPKNYIFPTTLEYLFNLCYNNKNIHNLALSAFKFFLHQPVSFIFEEKRILIGGFEKLIENPESLIYIDKDEEYFEFQNFLRESLGERPVEKVHIGEDPRVKRIKAKTRMREKIVSKKEGGLSFGASLAGICCMNLGITPLNIGQLSMASVGILTSCYQKKEKYDLDINSILAGADPKKVKPQYWLGTLNKD